MPKCKSCQHMPLGVAVLYINNQRIGEVAHDAECEIAGMELRDPDYCREYKPIEFSVGIGKESENDECVRIKW